MTHTDFIYSSASDLPAASLTASIFADRAHLRDQIRADVAAAGLAVRECTAVPALLTSELRPLSEVVLLDCPRSDARTLAALLQLDSQAARAGTCLIISTSVAALEDVFACCDQSAPEILVDPSRTDRVLALGRVVGRIRGSRVRELSELDRLALLRLTKQVGEIAQRLEQFGKTRRICGDKELRLESPSQVWNGTTGGGAERLRSIRPALPDPRLVRRIIRQRQLRARYFEEELFGDPAWNMLLDLTAARAEHTRVSVTSLCIASGAPPTTALRWIGQMTEAGLFQRVQDDTDRRRVFIALTDRAADAMARYFDEIGVDAAEFV